VAADAAALIRTDGDPLRSIWARAVHWQVKLWLL
jgi:hypothetical protein